ncbi:MAG: tyrosine-type recombinase/integrase [Rhodomicrobium sp.]
MARQGKETGSKARITKRAIDDLRSRAKSEGRTLYLRDEELTGFGALSTRAGACSYFVEYRLGGRATTQKRMTIGKHGVLTPDEARKLAKEALGKVARGDDVAQSKKEAREKLTGQTLKDAIERFLASNNRPGRYWVHKQARLLGKDMEPLHNRPIVSIKRSDVLAVIDKVKARSEAAARLLFVDLRPFFKWAVERELMDTNPAAEMKPPAAATKRDRVLEDIEVKAFWKAASDVSWPFASIYKLLLLTGARREEVAGMKWSELDLDAGMWFLPGARTKNKRDHRIPLSCQAINLLDRLGIVAIKAGIGYEDADLVFSTTGHSAPSGFSKAKKILDAKMKAILGARFKDWRVHDLRRTCATGMEDLGIDTRVVETALNHVSGTKAGIVGVYQRSDHRDAVAAAFGAWGARVMEIVSGEAPASNVVRFAATR